MKSIRSMQIWGDSILKGVVYDDALGKYRQCSPCAADILAEAFPVLEIKNSSRFGNIIGKGRRLIEKALSSGRIPDAALIEFGGNDCDFNWREVSAGYMSDHEPNTPLLLFREELCRIVSALREYGVEPIIMNLPPISADRYFDWFCRDSETDPDRVLHWLREKQIIYRTQERYSHAADITAKELDVPLLDIRTEFLGIRSYCGCLCTDGIHLNEKGQRLLGETMARELKSILDLADE